MFNMKDYQREYYLKNKVKLMKRGRLWKQNHREEVNLNERNRRRLHCLGTINGKVITGLNKRPYTNYCEICKKSLLRRLAYHHWNKLNPSIGMWLCHKCRMIVELTESGEVKNVYEKYFQLKRKIELEMSLNGDCGYKFSTQTKGVSGVEGGIITNPNTQEEE